MSGQIRPLVSEREILARFVRHERWIRADRTIRQDAFIPPRDLNHSVTRHAELTPEQLWSRGRRIAGQRDAGLFGRADVHAAEVRSVGLEAVEHPLADNPEHAHVVGWPLDKPAQKNKAQELAARSTFVAADAAQ